MKLCNQCNKNWPDDFNLCPVCGSELLLEQQVAESVSMGDGNAINGGVTVSKDMSTQDDHSISSSHNTSNSHNKTTNIITEHIYNGPVPTKTTEELLRDRKLKFRDCCKQVLADGLVTREERLWLEEQRCLLELSAEMADHILSEVNSNHQRTVMTMGTVQRIQFNNFKRSVEGNMVQNVEKLMPQIKVIANKFQEEELQYIYHMALAALYPEECVQTYQQRQEDKYWLTFWVYVALHKLGDISNAENALIDLGRWSGLMPDENLVVLGALGALIENDKETADEMFSHAVSGEHSPLLTDLVEVITLVIHYDSTDTEIVTSLKRNQFYLKHFLQHIYSKALASEEEARRKAEEEARRKAEEEARRKAEEEARRKAEEEARRKAEEEARRKAEEEARRKAEEEARRKAEEEARRKAEEEARRKAEEEARRKAKEEARRKAEEEARRKAEEEARRKAKEEARRKAEEEARRKAEEEARRKAEEEARRKAEEEARRKVEEERGYHFCKKCGKKIPLDAKFCKHCGNRLI